MSTSTDEMTATLTGALCFVIDSPMNALVASIIGRKASRVNVICAFDAGRKNVDEYLHLTNELLSSLKVDTIEVVDFDSARFWGGEKNQLLPKVRALLDPIVKGYPSETTYFGNCLTNPVALAMKKTRSLNHLYHAPGDFVSMLFPTRAKWITAAKNLVKKAIGQELYEIEVTPLPIFTLLSFRDMPEFTHLDYRVFDVQRVSDKLSRLMQAVAGHQTNVMLLLAGDEPEPGDKNQSKIEKYVRPHVDAVTQVLADEGLSHATVWMKEHKSYLPLTQQERLTLTTRFAEIGCDVQFVSDFLPQEYRSLPGECILRYCSFRYVVAEPSAFLFNVAGSEVTPVAAVSYFAPFRDAGQLQRNAEFMAINRRLTSPVRVL